MHCDNYVVLSYGDPFNTPSRKAQCCTVLYCTCTKQPTRYQSGGYRRLPYCTIRYSTAHHSGHHNVRYRTRCAPSTMDEVTRLHRTLRCYSACTVPYLVRCAVRIWMARGMDYRYRNCRYYYAPPLTSYSGRLFIQGPYSIVRTGPRYTHLRCSKDSLTSPSWAIRNEVACRVPTRVSLSLASTCCPLKG